MRTGVSQPTPNFTGRTVLVTGANVGLGFEAAAQLIALDADRVILLGYKIGKGSIIAERLHPWLRRVGGNPTN